MELGILFDHLTPATLANIVAELSSVTRVELADPVRMALAALYANVGEMDGDEMIEAALNEGGA